MQQSKPTKEQLYGSPPFNEQPTLSGGGDYFKEYTKASEAGRFLPLNKIVIANNSSVPLKLQLDGNPNREHFVEANTQEIFHQSILPFRSYRLVNLDGSTSTSSGEIKVTASKAPLDADDYARRQAQQEQNGGIDISKLAGLANLLG